MKDDQDHEETVGSGVEPSTLDNPDPNTVSWVVPLRRPSLADAEERMDG